MQINPCGDPPGNHDLDRPPMMKTGEPSMRMILGWAGALIVASTFAAGTRGDEPTRPTASATEATPAIPAAGHSLHGEAFDDGPRRNAELMTGMGKISFPVSTKFPE